MIISILRSIVLSIIVISSSSFANTSDESLFMLVKKINKTLPMNLDDITTWKSVGYSDYTKELLYHYIVDQSNGTINKTDTSKAASARFCSSSDTRPLLEHIRIKLNYFDSNGAFLFQVKIVKQDC